MRRIGLVHGQISGRGGRIWLSDGSLGIDILLVERRVLLVVVAATAAVPLDVALGREARSLGCHFCFRLWSSRLGVRRKSRSTGKDGWREKKEEKEQSLTPK